jgi:hypothetical protein
MRERKASSFAAPTDGTARRRSSVADIDGFELVSNRLDGDIDVDDVDERISSLSVQIRQRLLTRPAL